MYVDDIIIIGSCPIFIQQLTDKLNSRFSLKQLGKLDYFLGIEVKSIASQSLLLTQSKYIRDLLQKTNMIEAQPISSPMITFLKLFKIGLDTFPGPTLYRFVVGTLPYLTITGPEISFAVNNVCQFISHPLEIH